MEPHNKNKWNNSDYYSTIAPFYHIRAKDRVKYAMLLHNVITKWPHKTNRTLPCLRPPTLTF